MTHPFPFARHTLALFVLSACALGLTSPALAQAPAPAQITGQEALVQAAPSMPSSVMPPPATLQVGGLPAATAPGAVVSTEPNPFAPAPVAGSAGVGSLNGVPEATPPPTGYPVPGYQPSSTPPPNTAASTMLPGAVGGDIYAPGGAGTAVSSAPPAGAPTALPPLPPPTVTGQVSTVVEDYLGMTPEQIRALRRTIDERQKAAAEQPNPPKAVTGSISVSLSPGSTPPVIRTSQGSVSSFVVVDATGASWPVENFQVGSPLFKLSRLDQGQGSTFAIETMGMYGQSNIILKLAGIPTPVSVTLLAGQREMDSRVELRVQGRGPNASIVAGSLPQGADARLLSVLDGVPPDGGRRLKVTGLEQVSAWLLPDQTLVVRTPVRIIKPATTQFVSSSDGTYVYTFRATPLLLGIANGQFVNIGISGW